VGITATELCKRYPVLYHMASFGSWQSIARHGLLSTESLLDLFEVSEPRRTELLTMQRRTSVEITHPKHGKAILRDQKPLSAKNLARCLKGCSAEEWYRSLNQRLFFWLDRERLYTLMSASEYVGKKHTVLQLDSASLVSKYAGRIMLAHMNTGNTRPFPHPRSPATFRSMNDYPYAERKRLPDYSAVVELTVLGGVPDAKDFVTRVEHASITRSKYKPDEVLFTRTPPP
jgi:hypothetical protein